MRPSMGGITKMFDGVTAVKNNLEVVAPSKREAVEEDDEATMARVKEHFAKDKDLKKADIAVQTNAEVRLVDLRGQGHHDECPCVLGGLVRHRHEVREKRSHGEG